MTERSVAIRLAVRGADDVRRTLETTGQAGARALQGIHHAAAAAGVSLTAMRVATGQAGAAFGTIASAASVAMMVARVTAGVGLILSLANTAQRELDRLVEIGDRAARLNVGTTFLQVLDEQARRLGMTAREVDGLLQTFERNTRPRFEQTGNAQSRVDEFFLANDQVVDASARTRWMQAQGTEERLRAALEMVRAIRDQMGDLAAIDLAERLFPAEFVERMRQSRTFIDSFIAEQDRIRQRGQLDGTIVSPEAVENAQGLRDRLQAAREEIERNLLPMMRDVASLAVALAAPIDLFAVALATASRWANALYVTLRNIAGLAISDQGDRIANTQRAVAQNEIDALRRRAAQERRGGGADGEARARALDEQIAAREAQMRRTELQTAIDREAARRRGGGRPDLDTQWADRPPSPGPNYVWDAASRTWIARFIERPPDAPAPRDITPPRAAAERVDPRQREIERFVEGLERSVRMLEAEAAAQGLSNAERERMIQLARIGTEDLTPRQLADIERLLDAQGRLRESIRQTEERQRAATDALKFGAETAMEMFSMLGDRTKSAGDMAEQMFRRIAQAALQAAFLGQGPLAGILGLAGQNGQPGGLAGALAGLLGIGGGGGGLTIPVSLYHEAGVVGAAGRPRRFHAGTGGMGGPYQVGSDEMLMIARRDEEVLRRDDPRHVFNRGATALGGGASVVNVTINDMAGTDVRARPAPGGGMTVDIMDRVVGEASDRNSDLVRTLAATLGVERRGGFV